MGGGGGVNMAFFGRVSVRLARGRLGACEAIVFGDIKVVGIIMSIIYRL